MSDKVSTTEDEKLNHSTEIEKATTDVEEIEQVDEEPVQDDEQSIENVVEYELPISALPPRVVSNEGGQAEVSSSPAFQCLDDLFQEGRLTGTKVALLKSKYTELHETLKKSRESELSLLKEAKSHGEELEKQILDLESANDFPENCNTEVAKLRKTLLQHNNTLKLKEDAQYQLDYKLDNLLEEKSILEREVERLPNSAEMERKVIELQKSCDELRREILQRHNESKTLKEDIERNQRNLKIEKELYVNKLNEVDRIKADLVVENSKPGILKKEIDRFSREYRQLEKEMKEMDQRLETVNGEFSKLNKKKGFIEDDGKKIKAELEKTNLELQEAEQKYDVLVKDFEYVRERETMLLGDKGTLDMNLRHINLEKKNLHEMLSRKQRERDRDTKTLKKMELQLKIAADNLANTSAQLEKVKGNWLANPKDDGSLEEKKNELRKDVEQTKRALANQNSLTTHETVKVEQSIAMEERLLYQQSDLRIEVVELTRLAAIKNDEREQKARDFMRAELRFNRAVQDVKTKDLQIQDYQKKVSELNFKLKDFAKLYDVIKTERNKCVHLIQTSTQKAAEMREKMKILMNEIEILRTNVAQKERLFQKARLKHSNSIVIRDSIRNELAKQQRIDDDMRDKREQQQMEISKLNLMINQTEERVAEQRKRYETATQQRNERGLQLIERNEEVCLFLEKVNIQDDMIRNGDIQLKAKEEEIRFLNMQRDNDKREITITKRQVPNKAALKDELVTLNVQLQACQDRLIELESNLENVNDTDRVRLLGGQDLSADKLKDKLDELENRLAMKEEQMLEKDLIFQQVSRLSLRIEKKADTGKTDTLELAKKINEMQARIKDVTRKMMCIVSELSMKQAQSVNLQRECKEKEEFLENAYNRLEKNEAPSMEFEIEWNRFWANEQRRNKERLERQEEQQNGEMGGGVGGGQQLADGVYTTAEPRPNAYLPDDNEDLPIPRPYGKHAPFKPAENGSNMRHIRKPVLKPIEI